MPTQGETKAKPHTYSLVLNEAGRVEVEDQDNFFRDVKVGDRVQFITPIAGATVRVEFKGTLLPFQEKTIKGTDFHDVVNATLSPSQWMATTLITTPDGTEHPCEGPGHGSCSGCSTTG